MEKDHQEIVTKLERGQMETISKMENQHQDMVAKMAVKHQELVARMEEEKEEFVTTIRLLEERLANKDGEVEEVLQRKTDDAAIAQKGRKDAERALEDRTGQLSRMEERMVQREEEVSSLQGAVDKNQKLLEKERQR